MQQADFTRWKSGKTDLDLETLVVDFSKKMNAEAFRYLEKRGIQQETAERFRIGFEPGRIGFHVSEGIIGDYFENRVIIPVIQENGEIADLVGRAIDHREPKYKPLLGADDVFFNPQGLLAADDVVLCNGMFDVLTLAQAALPAVCLPNMLMFKDNHAEHFAGKRIFICLGNDEVGRRESLRIRSLLAPYSEEAFIINLPEAIRDINELFVRVENPLDVFINLVNRSLEDAIYAPVAPDVRNATVFLEEYMKRHRGGRARPSTGIQKLDGLLGGDMENGLHVLAGPASTGKTTLLRQIADNIALNQQPAVYFTWDLSYFEMWAVTMARLLGQPVGAVLRGQIDPEAVQQANQTYLRIGQMLWTIECGAEMKFAQMEASVERISVMAGRPPVVFMDPVERLTHNDDVIQKLKQWSREWNTPIWLSASADEPQHIPVAIRSTVDTLLFMEAHGYAKDGNRNQQLRLLKNRFGGLSSINLCFYESQSLFTEQPLANTGKGDM